MKWDTYDTSYQEVLNYLKIKQFGGSIPDLAPEPTHWKCFGKPVLILEKLLPLDETDDEYELGRQLLKTQLPFIHQFAVHCDLKPDNIMKRAGSPPTYFIIDMDLSTEKLESGAYKRLLFTPLYNSQMSRPYQVASFRADLEELYAVIVSMFFTRLKFLQHPWWLRPDTMSSSHSPEYFKILDTLNLPPLLMPNTGKKGPPTPEEIKKYAQPEYFNNRLLYEAVQQSLFTYMGTSVLIKLCLYLRDKVPMGGECPLRIYREMFDILNDKKNIEQEREKYGIGLPKQK